MDTYTDKKQNQRRVNGALSLLASNLPKFDKSSGQRVGEHFSLV